MIIIKSVYASYGNKKVLENINLTVSPGEILAVIGLSGTGKSTLLKTIIGIVKPVKGDIVINDINITKLNESELNRIRKDIGMVFQGAALFDSLTVAENVAFGLRRHTKMNEQQIKFVVSERLKTVGLSGIEDLMPSFLSGGMQKRVGIARALATDPKHMLYDEPTTGLDPIMANNIEDLIISLSKSLNVTTIIVTHHMSTVFKVADRIAMLYNGKIIEEGTKEEIINSSNPIVHQFIKGTSDGPIDMMKLHIFEKEVQ